MYCVNGMAWYCERTESPCNSGSWSDAELTASATVGMSVGHPNVEMILVHGRIPE